MALANLYTVGIVAVLATIWLTSELLDAVTDPGWEPSKRAVAAYLVALVGVPAMAFFLL